METAVESECRACLEIKESTTTLLKGQLAIIFTDLTAINANENERICDECREKLLSFKDFKDRCLDNNEVLEKRKEELQLDIKIEELDLSVATEEIKTESVIEEIDKKPVKRKSIKRLKKTTQAESKADILCPFEGCDRIFLKQDRLVAHLRGHEGKKEEVCKMCDKEFTTMRNLKRHMDTHAVGNNKTYQCQFCDKTFATAVSKKNHENMHTKEKLYICDTCGQVFHYRSGLAIHQNRHIDEKKFKCNQCPRAYKSKVELNDHLIRHKGIRDHVCEICNKTFLVRKDLRLHERIVHKAEPKFECTKCNKKYRKKCQLDSHMRVHTGERPFICTFCGKAFRVKQTLIKHTYSHTGEKPFQCSYCPKAYTEIFIMKRHVRQQHENNLNQEKETQNTVIS